MANEDKLDKLRERFIKKGNKSYFCPYTYYVRPVKGNIFPFFLPYVAQKKWGLGLVVAKKNKWLRYHPMVQKL